MMCGDATGATGLGILTVTLAALNVALNSWLAHRRLAADKREFKRNGNGHGPVRRTVPESVAHLIEGENRREADKD